MAVNTLSTFHFSFSTRMVVRDRVAQRLTAIRPPLLPDYNRDGAVGMPAVEWLSGGRVLYFWTNSDTWTSDDAFEPYGQGFHPNMGGQSTGSQCEVVIRSIL